MNWKIEHIKGGYRLYLEGFYPLPDHPYQIWWPMRKSETNYVFETFEEVLEKIKEGPTPALKEAKKKYLGEMS